MNPEANQPLSIPCPACGGKGHAVFGQSSVAGKLRWYQSIDCPSAGKVEEDGVGGGPVRLRDELLAAQGAWIVRASMNDKAKAISATKRLQDVPMADAADLLRSFPILLVGTAAEADSLVKNLAAEGLAAEALPSDATVS
jgi:hypothetical protein